MSNIRPRQGPKINQAMISEAVQRAALVSTHPTLLVFDEAGRSVAAAPSSRGDQLWRSDSGPRYEFEADLVFTSTVQVVAWSLVEGGRMWAAGLLKDENFVAIAGSKVRVILEVDPLTRDGYFRLRPPMTRHGIEELFGLRAQLLAERGRVPKHYDHAAVTDTEAEVLQTQREASQRAAQPRKPRPRVSLTPRAIESGESE